MNSTTITITGKSLTSEGITFVPGDGCPGYTGITPEVTLWRDDEQITVMVTDHSVFVSRELTDTTSTYVSTVTTTTTCFSCPVRIVSCRPDFSMPYPTDDDQVYTPGNDVPNYGMFSDEGNLAVENAIVEAIYADNMTTAVEVAATVKGHPEVNDTVVRDYIQAALLTAGLIRN
jgi:hypothetical protein